VSVNLTHEDRGRAIVRAFARAGANLGLLACGMRKITDGMAPRSDRITLSASAFERG
jgi:hypothetical protein